MEGIERPEVGPPRTARRKMTDQEKRFRRRADEILTRLANGETLRNICSAEGMPNQMTVLDEVFGSFDFRKKYEMALEIQAEMLMDLILEIADDGRNDWIASEDPEKPGYRLSHEEIRRARMRIDGCKWLIIKLAPDRYGPAAAKKEQEEMAPLRYLRDMYESVMRWEKMKAELPKPPPHFPARPHR